ncbi:hypothetical protein [Paenibacillus sp. NPDC058071]|uniref:hypothetical protein n=1 Tax=Paenibacillus sp. NPDC058071 TaxID=3346326 RepID=UPI0036D8F102
MNNKKSHFYKVTGELNNGELSFNVASWKLLIETNRYYEIKHEDGTVKRLYKEKLNVVTDETKHYAGGYLCCSAFCLHEDIDDLQLCIIQQLETCIEGYRCKLELNQNAINKQYLKRNIANQEPQASALGSM